MRESLGLCLLLPPAHKGCTNIPLQSNRPGNAPGEPQLLMLILPSSPAGTAAPSTPILSLLSLSPATTATAPRGHTTHKQTFPSYKSSSKTHFLQELPGFSHKSQLPTLLHKLCYVFPAFHRNVSKNSLCKSLCTLSVLNCSHQKHCEGCPEIWQGCCFISIGLHGNKSILRPISDND